MEEKLEGGILKEAVTASPSEIKKMVADGKKAVERFIQDLYGKLSKDYASERSLQFRDSRFPGLLMYGKLDLSERVASSEIVVTDFKTGSVKTKGVIEKLDEEGRLSTHMRQLAMYSFLVSGAERGTLVSLSRLFYLEAKKGDKNAIYETRITEENTDLLLKDIADYDKLLKNGEWVNRPCYNKSYGKNIECEYCRRAKIYQTS